MSRRDRRRMGEHRATPARSGSRRVLLALAVAAMATAGFALSPPGQATLNQLQTSANSTKSVPPLLPAMSKPTVTSATATSPDSPTASTAPPTSRRAAPPASKRPPSTPAQPPRTPALVTYTYSVHTRGPVQADIQGVIALAAKTYADPRGWSLGGKIAFRRVAEGGDFWVWLATPDQMASFGPPCDSGYSCRAGRNVVINEARWVQGSPAGVFAGDLTTYRTMIINHETGHWLGLQHRHCPAPGALAPLMQQQSISLEGCRPNAWPTPPELDTVRRTHLP